MFICPNCQLTLKTDAPTWRCPNNHAFDVGKNGNVNLLLPQQKRSKSPGDSKAMVTARRDFLASGAYQPIAENLGKIIMMLSQGMPTTIADAGCGEGYYLRQVKQLCFPQHHTRAQFIGWDISKFAVQSAAKQAHFGTWLTASNAHIPLAEESVDILLSLFGFEVTEEFARVVKSSGFVVTADVGENHLIEIRRLIYPDIKAYQEKPLLDNASFTLMRQHRLTYQIPLKQRQIEQLLLMTPHFFRAKSTDKTMLLSLDALAVTVDVNFRTYSEAV